MLENLERLFSLYPKKIKQLLRFLYDNDLELYLVGGSIRDLLDSGKWGFDQDFEVQSRSDMGPQQWRDHLDKVMPLAAKECDLSIEKLKFNVYRMEYEEYDLEFAPARKETYPKGKKVFGHSDFKIELLPNAPVEQRWCRRDFTVNAMGVKFDLSGPRSKTEFLDPFQGVEDLKARILRPVSEDFHKDPVRFVRSLRFSRKLHLAFGSELVEMLGHFNLQLLTQEALKRECLKDQAPVEFLYNFFELVDNYRVEISSDSMLDLQNAVRKLKKLDLKNLYVPDRYSSLSLLWHHSLEWNEADFLAFNLFWGGKKKLAKRVYTQYLILEETPEKVLELSSVEELRRSPFYGQLKKLLEFFESSEWESFREVIPEKTSSALASLLKLQDVSTLKEKYDKNLNDQQGAQRGDLKLLQFIQSLRKS
jgi:tRNA nucleotidyltransferase/poly(A) polymerase